jgi:hypothetical protein
MVTGNGNGAARPPRVEHGHSLAHRHLNKHQRAVIAADVEDGLAVYQPSRQELRQLLKVNAEYIRRARQLTPGQRRAILAGRNRHHPAISSPPVRTLALPKPAETNGNGKLPDATLFDIVRNEGIERILNVAATVEQAQH